MEGHRISKSQARWLILRNAVVNRKLTHKGDPGFSESVRSFTSHELFRKNQCSCIVSTQKGPRRKPKQDPCRWFSYVCNGFDRTSDLWIQHPDSSVMISDTFNNTGNVCIWPTEEVMAYYCLSQIEDYDEKSIVELGGGSSCLAGMAVGMNSMSNVLITDGNKKCVENLKEIVKMNAEKTQVQKTTENQKKMNDIIWGDAIDEKIVNKRGSIRASLIRWDDISTFKLYKGNFDYVLCADCLFFQEFHDALIETIDFLLKPGGIALIFAPKRGSTFDEFMEKCVTRFEKVTESDDYNFSITERHEAAIKDNMDYDPDLHYPNLIKIYKSYTIDSGKEIEE